MSEPTCKVCQDRKYIQYDHNHCRPCDACCPHDQGWWELHPDSHASSYIEGRDNLCCKGCGALHREVINGDQTTEPGDTPDQGDDQQV